MPNFGKLLLKPLTPPFLTSSKAAQGNLLAVRAAVSLLYLSSCNPMYRMPIKTNNYLNRYFCLLPDQRQHCWLFARKHHQHIPAKRGPTVQRKPDLNSPPGLSSAFCGPRGTKRRMLPLAGGVQRDTVCDTRGTPREALQGQSR